MMKVSCFIAGAAQAVLKQTIGQLQDSGVVDKIFVLGKSISNIPGIDILQADSFTQTSAIKAISQHASGDFTLFYTKSMPLKLGQFALERMARMAADANAGMLYADYYELKSGQLQPHPTIEYQDGSLRDDFNFGSLVLYKTEALKSAVASMDAEYNFAGLYDLRLRISQNSKIVRIPEYLYTEVETDTRKSGQKMFDYVDPKNRQLQIEMEQVCTDHLKKIGAFLEPKFKSIAFNQGDFPVEASVIIPVRNRVKTISDAIKSVLSQQTEFPFNLIVVDNFSTDGTTEILKAFATQNDKVIHVIPDRNDLGIGGCWTMWKICHSARQR